MIIYVDFLRSVHLKGNFCDRLTTAIKKIINFKYTNTKLQLTYLKRVFNYVKLLCFNSQIKTIELVLHDVVFVFYYEGCHFFVIELAFVLNVKRVVFHVCLLVNCRIVKN